MALKMIFSPTMAVFRELSRRQDTSELNVFGAVNGTIVWGLQVRTGHAAQQPHVRHPFRFLVASILSFTHIEMMQTIELWE